MNIPQANPAAFVRAHRAELDAAIARVLDGGQYILGPEVAALEREFAAFSGAAHAVAVASGTDALWLALKAAGVGPGDEVITVSFTATATVAAIVQTGARPVFVDVCDDDLTLDPAQLPAAITPRTKAIVPVHLYGQACRLDAVLRHGIPVIEDAAQAHGAPGINRGVAAAYSFYPTKNCGALGDAGMVVTLDAVLAGKLRELREYGWRERHVSAVHGWNSRLDELQAAILRVRLRHLPADNARRAQIAGLYQRLLPGLRTLPVRATVWHQFVVRHPERNRLRNELAKAGIGTGIHYPVPVHRQPAYATPVSLPVTESAAREVLSLPMFPELTDEEATQVASAVLGCGHAHTGV